MLRAKVTGITTQEERSEDTEAVKWVRIHAKKHVLISIWWTLEVLKTMW